MADYSQYNQVLKRFRERLRDTIRKKANEKLSDNAINIAYEAKEYAIKQLYDGTSNIHDFDSRQRIDKIANSFRIEETKIRDGTRAYSLYISNPYQNDGLALFLEYGTSVIGSNNPHPETSGKAPIGWDYIKNPEHSKYFYFSYKEKGDGMMPYLTDTDEYPVRRKKYYKRNYDPTAYTRKGKNGSSQTVIRKGYNKLRRNTTKYGEEIEDKNGYRVYPLNSFNKGSAKSYGIKPVRFMYNTKQYIKSKYGVKKK